MHNLDEVMKRIEAIERRQERILRTLWSLRGDFKSITGRIEKELGADWYDLMQKPAENVTKLPYSPTETYTFR